MADFYGTDGDDFFQSPAAGINLYYGFGGNDTISYSNSTFAVDVNLWDGDAVSPDDDDFADIIYSFENVIGSPFDDVILGSEAANRLDGGAGDDLLESWGGEDTLIGGEGTDTVVTYFDRALVVNLAGGFGGSFDTPITLYSIENAWGGEMDDSLTGNFANNRLSGAGGDDMLDGADGDDDLLGGAGDDTIKGGSGADQMSGGGDDDALQGGSGNDTMNAGDGQDTLHGGSGNDTLNGGAGQDLLDGGGGIDTASYAGAVAVVVNLSTGKASGDGPDTLSAIENVVGSAGNDVLTGDAAVNVLTGGAGNDKLQGGAGNDVLVGGDGRDTANYCKAVSAVFLDLAAGSATGGDGTDSLSEIENAIGSIFDDLLVGDSFANRLEGRAGDDVLVGDAGIDWAIYAHAASAVVVDLATGSATGGAGSDSLSTIENVTGSAFDDTLLGDGLANVLSAAAGDDLLHGGDGMDELHGGLGDDTLNGGNDNDRLEGGDGVDVLAGGVGRDVLFGHAGGDVFDFNAVGDSGTTKQTRDLVVDFEQGGDRIDLVGIDANTGAAGDQAFAFIGAAAFSGVTGQLRAVVGSDFTLVLGDVNGDKAADFQIELRGVYSLAAGDFVL